MGKLHQLLAVEGDIEGIYKRITEETKAAFKGKPALFIGQHKRCEMFEEGATAPPDEHLELTTTVGEKLDYTAEAIINYFDAVLQREETNYTAKADLVVDGVTLATSVPAPFLLGLETKLKWIRAIYDAIPTLQVGVRWELDEKQGRGIYRAVNPEEKLKTAKTFMHKVLYEATKEHKAQIEKWEEQVPVGKYITETYSGMISPAEKSALLSRVDKLIQAVKKARQKANDIDVIERAIGAEIMNYINGK